MLISRLFLICFCSCSSLFLFGVFFVGSFGAHIWRYGVLWISFAGLHTRVIIRRLRVLVTGKCFYITVVDGYREAVEVDFPGSGDT